MSVLSLPMDAGTFTISSGYGPRSGGFHYGIDYAAPLGTAIYAAASGTVAAAGSAHGFGQWVILDHIIGGSKVSTVYGHMYPAGVLVKPGQIVSAGQHIANVGANGEATGPHLHFEVWPGGRLTGGHAVDPSTYVSGNSTGMHVENVGIATDVKDTISTVGTAVSVTAFLLDPSNYARLFMFIFGMALVAFVIWNLMQNGSAN